MSDTAVLVVDMMNTYQHPDAEELIPTVGTIIEPLAELVRRVGETDGVDLIYVNDNYGDFTAEFSGLVEAALDGARPDLVKPIVPPKGSRMLTKVRHSAFYSTALGYLLGRLGTKRLIMTGQVTEQCILYSALDADIRHFPVAVPTDAVRCGGTEDDAEESVRGAHDRGRVPELTTPGASVRKTPVLSACRRTDTLPRGLRGVATLG